LANGELFFGDLYSAHIPVFAGTIDVLEQIFGREIGR
jgi:hypothetical protein